MRIRESDLTRIIKRTINESGLLLEKIACKDDDDCNASSVCNGGCGCGFPLTNSSCPCCVPICGKRHKDCGPLSVAPDSDIRTINESNLLLEKIACKDDDDCNASSVCDKRYADDYGGTPICKPICSKRHRDCGPLSVVPDSDIKQKKL